MRTRDVMRTPAHALRPTDALDHARSQMIQHRVDGMPVADDAGNLVGWLDALRVVRALARIGTPNHVSIGTQLVRDAMARADASSPTEAPIEVACETLVTAESDRIPVTSGRRLVGTLALTDALRALSSHAGDARVAGLARGRLPQVHRHATLPHVLREMRERGTRLVAVVEGQARATGEADDGAREHGIVGACTPLTLLAAAWFERGSPDVHVYKRVKLARRAETAGLRWKRAVREAEWLAEDMMATPARTILAADTLEHAITLLAEAGRPGLPVVGQSLPGYLDARDILRAILDTAHANGPATRAA